MIISFILMNQIEFIYYIHKYLNNIQEPILKVNTRYQ
jgi:hypothetical protein